LGFDELEQLDSSRSKQAVFFVEIAASDTLAAFNVAFPTISTGPPPLVVSMRAGIALPSW